MQQTCVDVDDEPPPEESPPEVVPPEVLPPVPLSLESLEQPERQATTTKMTPVNTVSFMRIILF